MTSDANSIEIERADRRRRQLRKVIGDLATVAEGLRAASAPVLRKLDEQVGADSFRVLVIGEFKRGKSTLINAILGENILPAHARPTTAVPTELYWSETPTAVVHPADGKAPVQVAVEDLSHYISIAKGIRQDAENTSPWKLAQVGWPLDMLQSGVVIIDSPA